MSVYTVAIHGELTIGNFGDEVRNEEGGRDICEVVAD